MIHIISEIIILKQEVKLPASNLRAAIIHSLRK